MYPNETAEHHRDHRCRNKEVNQFCYDPISKYRGNFCGCITRHHPVWAGSRSWVSRHLSLHLSIRGDEVRVRSCLIFRYRIWPKKQCMLEKHNNLLQKYNSCRLLLTITHKYLSHETRKHRHIIVRVAAFWQRVFQTLPNLDVHPGVAVYHTLKIFSIVNAKDLLMPQTKFQVCTLKINTILCHRKKKIPLLLNRSVYYKSKTMQQLCSRNRWYCHLQLREVTSDNTKNFLDDTVLSQYTKNWHAIAQPCVRVMGCILWLHNLISMAQCKTAVTPLLTHWSYCSL